MKREKLGSVEGGLHLQETHYGVAFTLLSLMAVYHNASDSITFPPYLSSLCCVLGILLD